MKLGLLNFGPIRSFSIDLDKDLSFIVGKNNIGKSYAIRAAYLILKDMMSHGEFGGAMYRHLQVFGKYGRRFDYESPNNRKRFTEVETAVYKKLQKQPTIEVDVTEELSELVGLILGDQYLDALQKSLVNSFDGLETLKNFRAVDPLEITFEVGAVEFRIALRYNRLEIKTVRLGKRYCVKLVKTDRRPLARKDFVRLYCTERVKGSSKVVEGGYLARMAFSIVDNLTHQLHSSIRGIYLLPASRSGLYEALSTFSAVIAELSKSRKFISERIEIPTISEPVADYFLHLSTITGRSKKSEFSQIAKVIEKSIMKGVVSFDKESKKIVYTQEGMSKPMDLSLTSSMISEIAPIVAFFKYVLSDAPPHTYTYRRSMRHTDSKYIIFFEEPEAHLHPEVQIELMRIFKMMVDADVRLVITTHSNFMFNKLGNMLLGEEIQKERVGSYLMLMTSKGSVLDGDVMHVSEDGIPDENFSAVTEKLFNEREEIYNKMD